MKSKLRLNFDVWKIHWYFDWCDSKYDGWGSPTCPEEPHSHLKRASSKDWTEHWVNYHNKD